MNIENRMQQRNQDKPIFVIIRNISKEMIDEQSD